MKINLVSLEDTKQSDVRHTLERLNQIKEDAVAEGNEKTANSCWRDTESLRLNVLYIEAFNKLKEHRYRDAWIDLERCEIAANYIQANSSGEFFEKSRCRFIKEKVMALQSLFPYCLFLSPCFIVGYYTCSICGHKIRPRSRCMHVGGKIYQGELCVHEGHDLELIEVSLVTNPVQKYSVIHNDETLDFSLIDYLINLLDNAFENWDINWTKKSFPIKKFSRVDPGAKCPCKSGKSFAECCIDRQEVEIPHVDFILQKNVPLDKARIRFPY